MLGWAKKAGGSGPPLPTDGVPWGLIYDVDFTALPPVASFPLGANDLAGVTWWLKGTFTGSLGTLSSSLGASGLVLTTNHTAEGAAGAPSLRWFVRLSELTNRYNPAAPLAVWARLSTSVAGDSSGNAIIGVCNGDDSSLALTDPQRATRSGIGCIQGSSSFSYWSPDNATGPGTISSGVSGDSAKYGLELLPDACAYMVVPWSAGPSDPYVLPTGVGYGARFRPRNPANMANLGVYFACNYNFAGAMQQFRMLRLQIMQPVVK